MFNLLASLSTEQWSAIFSGVSLLIVGIGMVIGIRNLIIIRKTHQLEAFNIFIEELESTREDRKLLYLLSIPHSLDEINPDDLQRLEKVTNSLNRIGLLIEEGILPRAFVFGITHTMIIRCYYKLEPFLRMQEAKIGGRYGRRIARIDRRAKLYHDIRPQQRRTKIMLHNPADSSSRLVYESEIKSGVGGLLQQLSWFVRDIFSIF